ncbi:hypothetical protein [Polaromonas eurypsychrophila]|uniref:hypothetical protein n=1 Tax=Polaromonas eurypsychrophila TaxID=1614635 RepID=UPI00166BF2BB|nr:hypothetical protein [Polaromonas eurypsychrophila]
MTQSPVQDLPVLLTPRWRRRRVLAGPVAALLDLNTTGVIAFVSIDSFRIYQEKNASSP